MPHFDIWVLLEIIGITLGGGVFLMKFLPQLRTVALVLQIAFGIVQILNGYLKTHPHRKKQIEVFISQMADHYFKTHPEGKRIAKQTELDEKVNKFLTEHEMPKHGNDDLFYKMLGVTVDKK